LVRRACGVFPWFVCFSCWGASALAADPLNSNNRPAEKQSPITAQPDAKHPEDEAAHNEVNVVPVLGGSTDLGFGGGYFAGFARVKKGAIPYLWNIVRRD